MSCGYGLTDTILNCVQSDRQRVPYARWLTKCFLTFLIIGLCKTGFVPKCLDIYKGPLAAKNQPSKKWKSLSDFWANWTRFAHFLGCYYSCMQTYLHLSMYCCIPACHNINFRKTTVRKSPNSPHICTRVNCPIVSSKIPFCGWGNAQWVTIQIGP